MRISTAIIACFFWHLLFLTARAQSPEQLLLNRLDSVAHTKSIASHFASLYRRTSARAFTYYRNARPEESAIAHRFMLVFADYFFQSAQLPSLNWQAYYSDSSRTILHYQLLGMNAHINGDLWQALYRHFSYEEFKQGRRLLIRFQQVLRKEFNAHYEETIREKGPGRTLHMLSAGLSRYYGHWKLLHWRKRQFRLANRMFDNPDKATLRLRRITRKKQSVDRLILRHL